MANQPSPQELNAYARAIIRARAVRMTQSIFTGTFATPLTSMPVVTVNPRNVGLVTGFWVKVALTVSNGSAITINLADFAPSTVFSQIQFNDLQNNTRIQTTGWHLNQVNSYKSRRVFDSALVRSTGQFSPINYGNNWTQQITAPTTIAASGSGSVVMWYYVPLAYSHDDLRGAVYMNVVNAQAQLNFTFNQQMFATYNTDSTQALYVGSEAGSIAACAVTSATVTVYQDYLDQLPAGPQGVILPLLDLATIYELKNTTFVNITANQDFPMQYANFRDFLSTTVIYVNNGTTGARGVGADVNYWALQSANFTNIWKMEPGLVALKNRSILHADPPAGCYFFSSREKPISTVQYGNMQLILNAASATNNPVCLVGYEDFALVNTLSMAGSLAAS